MKNILLISCLVLVLLTSVISCMLSARQPYTTKQILKERSIPGHAPPDTSAVKK